MKDTTKEAVITLLYADETIDSRMIDATLHLLIAFDRRTDEEIEKAVEAHVINFCSRGSRSQQEIRNEINRIWRIENERAFNPVALRKVDDMLNNPESYGIIHGGKTKRYFFSVPKHA